MAIFCACGHFAIWPIYQADPPDHVTGPHGSMKRRTVSDPHPPLPPPFIGPTFFFGGGGANFANNFCYASDVLPLEPCYTAPRHLICQSYSFKREEMIVCTEIKFPSELNYTWFK